jgi:hypothetical protein
MIGRERVAAQLADLIRASPVVAVVGPLGIGKTELVRWVVEREAAAGRVPAPAYASLAGVDGAREILERTCRALARRCPPVESSRLVPALCALFNSTACTLVWDDAQDAPPEALAATLVAPPPPDGLERSCRIVIVARDPVASNQAAVRAWAERSGIASLEVPPLDVAACRHLIEALEHRRERSLQDEAILASGGNPLALQLAIAATSAAGSDPMVVLGHAIDALPPDARAVLFALLAAETSLRDADLHAVCGPGTSGTLLLLERHALVVRDGDRVSLPPPMMRPVRSIIGPPQPATWEALEALARRALAGAPDDSEALLLACRALAHRGRAPEALALLRGHVAATPPRHPTHIWRSLASNCAGATSRPRAALSVASPRSSFPRRSFIGGAS